MTGAEPAGALGEGASAKLAAHVAGARYENLPPGAVHAYKRALLDHLACAIAGASMPVSRALLSYFQETDASRVASVIGATAKLSAQNAALVNGANTHGLDFDDGTTQGSAHPSGAIFPAVLAAAEQHGATPRAIILATVMGYDVMIRIAAAMHPVTAKKGFHNTPLAGVFGAAAAVASLIELDAAATNHALGLAGSFAGGIRQYLDDGAEVKRIHPGKAARDGLLCAEFAKRGITGPGKVLEGRYGFADTHAGGQFKWDRLLAGLGSRYEIESVYFKPYPCCRHYHAVMDGIRALKEEQGVRAQDVTSLRLGLYAVGVHGHEHKHCENLLDAQMSAPVGAALALTDGDVSAQKFLPDSLARPEVRRLIELAETRVDEACERLYPQRRSGAVEIGLRDGRTLAARVLDPRGEGENPMSDADIERKFMANCAPLLGEQRCEAVLQAVWRFDEARDLRELLSLVQDR
ncbi:MAG TPA: MmgE/PrpD family protein [Burkholderiales bacterium]|nr:MmgE/PrpD family protein [Burkholderiales bacterium]